MKLAKAHSAQKIVAMARMVATGGRTREGDELRRLDQRP